MVIEYAMLIFDKKNFVTSVTNQIQEELIMKEIYPKLTKKDDQGIFTRDQYFNFQVL